MKYSFTLETPLAETAAAACTKITVRREVVDALSCATRLLREYASTVLLAVASHDPKLLVDFEAEIVDALDRPESLTRYNTIQVIGEVARVQAKIVQTAFEPLEDCLYDEDSGTVRLYAFRVLAAYGATGTARSVKIWPDLSMAVRCYHGDAEFIPMINELIAMLSGKVDQSVKDAAAELFAFDADNAKGVLQRKAQTICDFAPEVIVRLKAEAKKKADEAEARKAAAEAAAAAVAGDDDDEEEEIQ